MFTDFINNFYSKVAKLPFDYLVFFVLGTYIFIFILAIFLCIFTKKLNLASKRPFLCLTNAYAAVTLAAFLLKVELPQAILAAAIFWILGYFLYGVLCILPKKREKAVENDKITVSAMPVSTPVKTPPPPPDAPPAKSTVRLDHAVAVTDKLLTKNLSKGDRQELEKMKNTLAVLQIKGNLTPVEAEILNENFNALLKLMAKYNA